MKRTVLRNLLALGVGRGIVEHSLAVDESQGLGPVIAVGFGGVVQVRVTVLIGEGGVHEVGQRYLARVVHAAVGGEGEHVGCEVGLDEFVGRMGETGQGVVAFLVPQRVACETPICCRGGKTQKNQRKKFSTFCLTEKKWNFLPYKGQEHFFSFFLTGRVGGRNGKG